MELIKIRVFYGDLGYRKVQPKSFRRFSLLPPEIRQIVYSKLQLIERISAAEIIPEAEAYFVKHRLKKEVYVKMSVEEANGRAYIRTKFLYQKYVEMHRIPDALVDRVRRDLDSSKGCVCEFCDENCWNFSGKDVREGDTVRYFDYDPKNVDTVFQTFRLIEPWFFDMRSAPVGGLVDLLLPVGQLSKPAYLEVQWHLQENVCYPRDDPNVNVERWGKWLNFARPTQIEFNHNLGKQVSGSDPDEYYYDSGPPVYIPKDFFDLEAIRNADKILMLNCLVDFNYRQLISMNANEIDVYRNKSKLLTPVDILKFYKRKIKEWLCAPDTKMSFFFGSKERRGMPPHLNYERLLADLREELELPDFRVYPNYNFHNTTTEHSTNSITIRCLKAEQCLVVTETSLSTDIPNEKDNKKERIWPEEYGL